MREAGKEMPKLTQAANDIDNEYEVVAVKLSNAELQCDIVPMLAGRIDVRWIRDKHLA